MQSRFATMRQLHSSALTLGLCAFAVHFGQLALAGQDHSVNERLLTFFRQIDFGMFLMDRFAVDSRDQLYQFHSFATSSTVRDWQKATNRPPVSSGNLMKQGAKGQPLWSITFTNIFPESIAVRGTNNVFLVGQFEHTALFGQHMLKSQDRQDGFIARLDGNGTVQWAKAISGQQRQLVKAVTTDEAGSCYVTGLSWGSMLATSLTAQATNHQTLFVAKYDSNGLLLWMTENMIERATPRGIAVDAAGSTYVTGEFTGVAKFGSNQLSLAGHNIDYGMFISKFSPDGSCLWARSPGGPPRHGGIRVAVDSQGNPHVFGVISRTTVFGSTNFVVTDPTRNRNCFAARYTPEGEFHRVRQLQWGEFDLRSIATIDTERVWNQPSVPQPHNLGLKSESQAGKLSTHTPSAASANDLPGQVSPGPSLTAQVEGVFLLFSWPKEFAAFRLEACANITPMPLWEPVPFQANTIGAAIVVQVPRNNVLRFYRLRAPD